MSELSELVLTNLVAHGPPVLFAAAYLGSLGIPFPISLIVVAGGAFVEQGILDWRLAFVACLAGSVLADNSEYLLGRLMVRWLEKRFAKQVLWQRGLATFNRQGGLAILLTRTWLSTFAPVVNLIAGGRYPYKRFLFYDLLGEFLWILLYGGLGYLFGEEWELISPVLNNFTGLSIGLVALAVGLYFFLRSRRRAKNKRQIG